MAKVYNYVEVLRWAFPMMQEKKLTPAECYLFLYMLHCANNTYWKELSLSTKKIERDTGISRRSVFQIKKKLSLLGFLECGSGYHINYGIFPKNTIIGKEEGNKKGTPAKQLSNEERLADIKKFLKH